jgi:hypothetical protein
MVIMGFVVRDLHSFGAGKNACARKWCEMFVRLLCMPQEGIVDGGWLATE